MINAINEPTTEMIPNRFAVTCSARKRQSFVAIWFGVTPSEVNLVRFT